MTRPVSTLPQINSLENYQQHSRLHFIGQWKTKMKDYLEGCYEKFPSWNHGELSAQRTFIHMDMDAFFCSVQLAKPEYTHLRNQPVAISAGRDNSDIASCNYIARSYGVHAGMYVNQAKERCPELVSIGYDFVACARIVKSLYHIIFDHFPSRYKMALEVYSVDDVMIATEAENMHEMAHFCNEVREELRAVSGCTVSCGIGPNILLSRLATTLAKPDGVYVLERHCVKDFIASTPFASIHGVGESTMEKVKQALVERGIFSGTAGTGEENRTKKGTRQKGSDILCEDVQRLSEKALQDILGKKSGSNFYRLCRGDDGRVVIRTGDKAASLKRGGAKTVACSMNYAVRPASEDDVWRIMEEVLGDVCQKLARDQLLAGGLRLTVLERHPLHPKTTQKFLGRGKCIEVNFLISFPAPLAADQKSVMMKQMQETLQPLLVQSRPEERCGAARARLLGLEDTCDQTIWTVSLPNVPDLLVEDIRGITVQASKLVPLASAAARKRPRPAATSAQPTLQDLLLADPPLTRKNETISVSPSLCSSPMESRRNSGQVVALGSTQKMEEAEYLNFGLLMEMTYGEEFVAAWKAICAVACEAKDYFMVRACLRCAALKLIEDMECHEDEPARADINTIGKERLRTLEKFVNDRLPFVLHYY